MISRNILFLAFLYFLQGLPYGLQSRFLPLYFRTHGMSLSDIGFFKLLLIPWMLKAIWAPLVDHYGTKKQWLAYSMFGLCASCLLGSLTSPDHILHLAVVLFLFNFLTATQDIAVDGIAIQVLLTSELASGNIAQVVGYKLGAVFSGGFLIWLSETLHISWGGLFVGLAAAYSLAYLAVMTTVPAPRNSENVVEVHKKDIDSKEVDASEQRTNEVEGETGHTYSKDETGRRHWFIEHMQLVLTGDETRWILLYVLVYKLGEQGTLSMVPLYLVDHGIAAVSVGFWTGVVGQCVSIAGSVLGGWLVSYYRRTPHEVVTFFSKLRIIPLILLTLIIYYHGNKPPDTHDRTDQTFYVAMVTCMSIMLLGSGIVTTATFTLMMYCSQKCAPSVQASHYTTIATVEVLGKLTFSVLIGSLTDVVGYLLVFCLFVILGLMVLPVLARCPKCLKKKQKKDPLLMKKARNDPNSPAITRIPLPELKDQDKMERINAHREALKRVKMGPSSLPSICFYTLTNAVQGLTSVEISEDSALMCTGFSDSTLRVWSLTPNKLRSIKQLEELEVIDKESDDVLERMMDDRTAEDTKLLLGHTGAVYSASFSPDRNYLTSASEDGTVRLWSLHTWTNLVSYKGHNNPVWDVKFSPHGHYFVSGGHDRVARLWTTDHYQPVRVFSGHYSDVDCVQFHPNGNYVATGSSDRTVRVYDILSGNSVRILTGHKGAVHSLCFSPDGKYLVSSGLDGHVILWDISNGNMVAKMKDHVGPVYSLSFSRCGSVLASGGMDNCVKLWDITKVMKDIDKEMDASIPSSISVNDNPSLLIGSFNTKSTPVLSIHFTRKNLLLAAGAIKVT